MHKQPSMDSLQPNFCTTFRKIIYSPVLKKDDKIARLCSNMYGSPK